MVIAADRETAIETPKVETWQPRIVAFLCNWCSYTGADLAGISRIQWDPSVSIVRVMCSGRMDPTFVVKAFRLGADGVIIKKTGTRNFRVRDGMGGSVPYSAKYIEIEAIVYLDK